MKTKIVGITKEDNRLKILFKKPLFKNISGFRADLYCLFHDEDSFLGVRYTEKRNILSIEFVLRNKKDIEPYKIDYENTEKSILSQYDYAILVKDGKAKLINDGREEKKVRSIYFESEPRTIPGIKIVK